VAGRREELIDGLAETPNHNRSEEQRHGEVEVFVDEAIAAGNAEVGTGSGGVRGRSHEGYLVGDEKKPWMARKRQRRSGSSLASKRLSHNEDSARIGRGRNEDLVIPAGDLLRFGVLCVE
jgi:hypothetical protein